jgi:hypothetical protein
MTTKRHLFQLQRSVEEIQKGVIHLVMGLIPVVALNMAMMNKEMIVIKVNLVL